MTYGPLIRPPYAPGSDDESTSQAVSGIPHAKAALLSVFHMVTAPAGIDRVGHGESPVYGVMSR